MVDFQIYRIFGEQIRSERLKKEIKDIHISFRLNKETGRPDTYLNGVNVENKIRSMEVSSKVSPISTLDFVREAMVAQQQAMGNEKGIVMDGRDIGTTVFPDAELKIFVTATPEIRAQRRYDELKAKGQEASFDEILENVKQRDYIDQNREVSPLRKAEDALLLDNTDLSIEEQKKWLFEHYMIARENNIEIIDATCPVVLRLQKRIRQGYLADSDEEKQIVIYGKSGHAEVLGLVGQTDGKAIVIEKAEEAKKLDLNKSIRLFSQTTKSLDEFQEIVEYFKQHISPEATFEYYDTICRQVANRMPKLREFAATHDLIFFVSGKKSSNGKMLFEECLKVNANSHLIDNEKEIDPSLLQNVKSIGVCGATSTPKWLMEKIYNHIRTLIKE